MMPILYPDHTRSDKPFHKQWICWVLVGIAIIISVSTILCAFWFKIRRFFRPDAVENDMDPIWRGNPRPSQPRRSPWQIRRNRNARPRIPAPRPAGQPPLVDWGFKDDVLLVLRTGNWRPWKWNFPKGNQQQGAEQQGIQEQGVPQLTAEERRIQSEDIALQTEQGLPIPLVNTSLFLARPQAFAN